MDMKRFILIVLSCALLLTGLAGCGKQNKVIKEHAQAVAEAFADGDMAAINMLIFGIDELEVDGELSDLWGKPCRLTRECWSTYLGAFPLR